MDTAIPLQGTIGYITAAIVTLLTFTYLLRDNPLYKLVIHIFIGAAAGYAGAIALKDVIIPRIMNMTPLEVIVPAILIIMLLLKASPKTARFGNISSALLLGVGAAIAINGAIQGTLVPLLLSSSEIFSPTEIQQGGRLLILVLQGFIILSGMITTLMYFHFSARKTATQAVVRPKIVINLAKIGQGFIAITFGVIFAGIYSAALTALVERINFLLEAAKFFQGTVN